MKGEFSKKDKYILLFAFIFMILPAFQTEGLGKSFFVCCLSLIFLLIQLIFKRDSSIFRFPFSFIDWFMLCLFVFGIADVFVCLLGIYPNNLYGLFLIAISTLYFATRTEWELTIECMSVLFFSGVLLITLSFVYFLLNTDILFGIGMKDLDLIGAVAAFIGLIGAYIYSIETRKVLSVLYCCGTIGSMICLSLCGNDMLLLLFAIGVCMLIMNADRDANVIKKLLMCLFCSLFFSCNAVLLVNYTSIIHAEVSVWSLQLSVAMELIIAIVAMIVCSYWDKVEENEEDAIKNLQLVFKSISHYLAGILVFFLLLGVVDIFLGVENILRLFHDGSWKPDGIFVSSFIEFSGRMKETILAAYQQNMLRFVFDAYGIIGLVLAVLVLGLIAYRVWNIGKITVKKDVLIWILSVLIVVESALVPMHSGMLLIYSFILFKTLHEKV